MVVKTFLQFLRFLVFALVLGACSVDGLGFFRSDDLDARLADRKIFHLLRDQDRNLSLKDEYTFIVLTDTHIYRGDAHGLEKLSSIIKPDIAFVVITGDITQNGNAEDLGRFIAITKTLGVPCYPVLGNHDIYFAHWPVWRDLIGSSSYRIDGSNTTLFILDSANAFLGKTQLDWLDRELETPQTHTFIFTHANLFVENALDLQQLTDIRERARIMAMLEGRCEALFSGHVHKRILKTRGGVQHITIEDFERSKTYCRVQVSPQGIRYTFHRL